MKSRHAPNFHRKIRRKSKSFVRENRNERLFSGIYIPRPKKNYILCLLFKQSIIHYLWVSSLCMHRFCRKSPEMFKQTQLNCRRLIIDEKVGEFCGPWCESNRDHFCDFRRSKLNYFTQKIPPFRTLTKNGRLIMCTNCANVSKSSGLFCGVGEPQKVSISVLSTLIDLFFFQLRGSRAKWSPPFFLFWNSTNKQTKREEGRMNMEEQRVIK